MTFASPLLPGTLSPTSSQGFLHFLHKWHLSEGSSLTTLCNSSYKELLLRLPSYHPVPLITWFIAFHSTCLFINFLFLPACEFCKSRDFLSFIGRHRRPSSNSMWHIVDAQQILVTESRRESNLGEKCLWELYTLITTVDLQLRSLFEFSLGTKLVFPHSGKELVWTEMPRTLIQVTQLCLGVSLSDSLMACYHFSSFRPRLDTLCFYLVNHKLTVA